MAADSRRMADIFRRLDEGGRRAVLDHAERLLSLQCADVPAAPAGRSGESVVMAIRRLTRTYAMLDRRRMMSHASRALAQHALDGRDAREVIEELEVIYERQSRDVPAPVRRAPRAVSRS